MSEQISDYIIYAFIACIVIALGIGLYFLLSEKKAELTAKALTVRISLSLTLFAFLFFAYAMGWIKPHGIIPTASKPTQIDKPTPYPQNANTTPPLQNQNGAQE